MGLGAEEHTNW
jgi:hypothetical protein